MIYRNAESVTDGKPPGRNPELMGGLCLAADDQPSDASSPEGMNPRLQRLAHSPWRSPHGSTIFTPAGSSTLRYCGQGQHRAITLIVEYCRSASGESRFSNSIRLGLLSGRA